MEEEQNGNRKGKPLSVSKLESYSSLKIEPKSSKKQTKNYPIGLPESINTLFDRFKTINNEEGRKKGDLIEARAAMFNTIETESNELIRRKLN